MWIEAETVSIKRYATARGERLYAVFRSKDGSQMGIWSPLGHPHLRRLHLGDRVILQRSASGRLGLVPQPQALLAQVGLWLLRNRYWQLI